MSMRGILALGGLTIILAGCQQSEPAPEPVRPVLSMAVQPQLAAQSSFVGVVAPQVSVDQAFRVGGTMVNRAVDVGDRVATGEVLASLDTTTLDLAVETAQANQLSAEAQYANAAAAEGRLRSLTQSDVVAVSNLEQAQQQTAAAKASVVQAQSRLTQAQEQRSYAQIVAPFDGVVTAVGAEAGAVVGAGQMVVTLAQTGARDVVIDVPEAFMRQVKVGTEFIVSPQLNSDESTEGKLREIAAEADAVTRTWRLKIGLIDPPDQFWLGTTASATLAVAEQGQLVIPETAVLSEGDAQFVWLVDAARGVVHKQAITAGTAQDGQVVVSEGIAAGDRVATAGVHSLRDGQAVTLDQGAQDHE